MTTIKVLYNNSYGSFNFSNAFNTEYSARCGKAPDTDRRLFHLGAESIRCDPVAVNIVETRGSEYCSEGGSYIMVREIPALFTKYWEIEEQDGDEHVRVHVDELLADILHTYMDSPRLPENLEALTRQYAEVAVAKEQLLSLMSVNVSDGVKEQAASISNADVHTYFDVAPSNTDKNKP